MSARIPLCRWTHDGDEVLFVKCVEADLSSHNGFKWPVSGEVEAPDWDAAPQCGNGLHGWPWGIGVGIGKEPSPHALVFAAPPDSVVEIEPGKCKVPRARVVYVGTLAECMRVTMPGRIAWIEHNAEGSAAVDHHAVLVQRWKTAGRSVQNRSHQGHRATSWLEAVHPSRPRGARGATKEGAPVSANISTPLPTEAT